MNENKNMPVVTGEAGFLMTPIGQETKKYELMAQKATMLAKSTIVPKDYQGDENVGNVIIAMEMADRMGVNPIMVMQNLYLVHGHPSWSSKFLIASFNQCGRFAPINYHFTGKLEDGTLTCRAYTYAKDDVEKKERIWGTQVSLYMAQQEGWINKNGSKWKTMPELMLRYRAATFLVNTIAPEISMGFMTDDEANDVYTDYTEVHEPSGKVVITDTGATQEEVDPAKLYNEPAPAEEAPASETPAEQKQDLFE